MIPDFMAVTVEITKIVERLCVCMQQGCPCREYAARTALFAMI
jgi:hypothetical protein